MRYLLTTLAVAATLAASAHQNAPISFESHSIRALDVNVRAQRYSKAARLTLNVRNNTDQRVKGWRAWVRFTDPFGDELFDIQLTSGTADIAPGETGEARFEFEDNQFLDGEPYDKLVAYSAENITITADSVRVVH